MTVRRGFTLLELLLVLAILVILSALVMPAIENMYAEVRLQAGADNLRSRLAEARGHAIAEQRPYRFAVKPNSSNYRLAPDAADQWGETPPVPEAATDDGLSVPPLVVEDVLPDHIEFQFAAGSEPSQSSGSWSKVVTFQPDGSCDDDRTIRLDLENCRPIEISIRQLTGAVTAKMLPKESR
jgi:prepilin-type N-terminal cleavage/methylation domain-containing protein